MYLIHIKIGKSRIRIEKIEIEEFERDLLDEKYKDV